MAFQIPVPFAVPVPEGPRKTDPRIQCIIDNEFSNLQKLIRGKDINGLYPFEVWTDDVTLLTAAVVCKNEEICSYLLEESADPNICSTKGQTPLHYAALTGVSLSIVKRLLTGKADPNGNELQIFTPLQCAVDHDREDIVKALIEAGASPENNYGRNPELDKKVERMIFQLSSQSKEFEKVHLFFSLFCAVQRKHQTEVYEVYKEHFFQEYPFIHIILFEHYFGVIGQDAEQYHQSAIKWLKDTKSADRYIERVIRRFLRIPQKHCADTLNCLYAALCVSESVSPQVFRLVYYILSGGQHPFGEDVDCEYNISRGRYSLEHLDDDVAKDLVEWMINEDPNNRPTVEQTLAHPFFWTDDRRVWYLKILGNEKEAENCRNADEELLNAVAKHSEGKSFSEWKTKLPSELVQKLDGKKKPYPENTLGLLRFIRNLHEHYKTDAVKINLMDLFPDLFGSVYLFAKERGWNSRENVIMDNNSAS